MAILYTNDIGTFFNQTLLGHIKQGESDEVLSILQHVDQCQLASSVGTTLLHFAAKYGNVNFARHLIDSGMSVDAQNRCGETPLMFAVNFDQLDAVKLLLHANADIFVPDISGQCVLGKVFSNKHNINENIVAAILDRVTVESLNSSAYVNNPQFHVDCPLHNFISMKNAEITRVLLEKGSPVDAKSSGFHETALHVASEQLDVENVKILLRFNANVNAKTRDGRTPLACIQIEIQEDQSRVLEIVKILIAAGAELIDRVSRKFMSKSLLLFGNQEVVRAVMQGPIDLNFQSEDGMTALHLLATNQHPDVMKEVQNLKPALKIRVNGFTMLHLAAMVGNLSTLKCLLENGADVDVNVEDNLKLTPLSCVVDTCQDFEKYDDTYNNLLGCAEILLEYGANPQLRRPINEILETHILLAEPVIAHVALLQASGQTVEESVLNRIASFEAYKNIFDLMKQELEEMKQVKIDESLTLLDFLTAHDENMVTYARNQRLISSLTDLMKQYNLDSYYHRMLRKSFLKFTELAAN